MPQGMAQCDRASFDPVRNLTQLFGHVRVVRGTTVLIGDVVEMNMATGVSRLVSKSGERVRAFLVPGGPSSGSKTDASAGIDGLLAPYPAKSALKTPHGHDKAVDGACAYGFSCSLNCCMTVCEHMAKVL